MKKLYEKTLVGVAFFCLLSSLTGCDMIYRMLDKEGAEEKELVGEILPFQSNARVEEIQGLLNIYGYNAGTEDGVLGLQTRNAIEKFQKDRGLNQTRFVDLATWEQLNVFLEMGLVSDGELNIVLIQKILKAAETNPGSTDGKMGSNTIKAVKKFQEKYSLKPDGRIGYKTLTEMSKYLVR